MSFNINREFKEKLDYIEKYLPDSGERLKKLLEKEIFLREGNVYGETYSDRQIEISYNQILETEYVRAGIIEIISLEAKSVKDIAEILKKSPQSILREIIELRRKNFITIDSIMEKTPLYRAMS